MTTKEYIDRLFKEIPKSRRRENIKEEIMMNLDDKVSDLVRNGLTLDEAIQKVIEDFGDITDLKEELMDSYHERNKEIGTNGKRLEFALYSAVLIIVLLVFTNLYFTPDFIWFVYPAVGVLWWPLAMYYRWRKSKD